MKNDTVDEVWAHYREELLEDVRDVTQEIADLDEELVALRQRRTELCRRGSNMGISTRALGEVAGVSGVAVYYWLTS